MTFRRIQATVVAALLLVAGVAITIQPAAAVPNPVATTDAQLAASGRVFPDPQGCEAYNVPDENGDGIKDTPEGVSPYAKGRVCAEQFLGYDEVIAGLTFLQGKLPRFVQVIRLDEAYDNDNYRSAGVPTSFGPDEDGNPQVLSRDRRPLYMFKITDNQSPILEKDRKHFAYSLSIHGIERAGVEGGIRALEDLVTWAACENNASSLPACADEGPFPKKIVETPTPADVEIPTAGQVLRQSVLYFIPPNPDGWRRGEVAEGGVYFQRYNGNGVDLNRDWPTFGYSYRPYSPGSEPETKAYAKVLTDIRDLTAAKKFEGGMDLHGQLLAVAFSFTLLGASQRDYYRNFTTVDTSLRTWRDQTERLSWSPYVADANKNGVNDPGESCPVRNIVLTSGNFPYCYADQWGSVVDTIAYQISGGLGDWFESPIGLRAVGIDNEMSMSHITPNNAYDPINEQMHVDGNKGLIYSQLSSMLTQSKEDYKYEPKGKIGYVLNPDRLQVPAGSRPTNPGLPAQTDINALIPCEANCPGGTQYVQEDPQVDPETGATSGPAQTLEFTLQGPREGVYNRGIIVEATFTNADGISPASIPRMELQHFVEQQWQTVATHYQQGGNPDLYLPAAQTVSVNDPEVGRWRVWISSSEGSPVRLKIDFRADTAEESPGQAAIDASSMDFFTDLNKFIPAGKPKLTPVTVGQILSNPSVVNQFDSLVVVDDFMPGFVIPPDPPVTGPAQADIDFNDIISPDPSTGEDAFREFEVKGVPDNIDNDKIVVTSTWSAPSDFDVSVEEFFNGEWVDRGCECSFVATGEQITVTQPEDGQWRIRVHNFAAVPQPVDVHIDFQKDPEPAAATTTTDGPVQQSDYTPAQFDQYAQALANFANTGGNLVLTDGALRGLKAFGIGTELGDIRSNQPSGRGAVPRYEFRIGGRGPVDEDTNQRTPLNLCIPNSPDPLLKDVCLPGTAGGTARQAVEPVPLGYIPDATLDDDTAAKMRQHFVTRAAWEAGCGKANTAECITGLLGAGVGLGERHFGDGLIRIAGSMLPDPYYDKGTAWHDMRFGVASYALTFTAWQLFLNLVDYQKPRPDLTASSSDITASASRIVLGKRVKITAVVHNVGNATAQDVVARFRLGVLPLGKDQNIGDIPAGGTAIATVNWTPTTTGTKYINLIIDPKNKIAESNEANNRIRRVFTVRRR